MIKNFKAQDSHISSGGALPLCVDFLRFVLMLDCRGRRHPISFTARDKL